MHSSKLATASSRLWVTQIKHAEVVQCFGIAGTKLQSFQQILVGAIGVVELRKDHPQAVVRFWVLRADRNRPLEGFASFIPVLLLTIRVPEVLKGDQVIGTQTECLLKVRNRFGCVSFPRGEQAEIIPCVR
jgi:hypothetical protein